MKKASLLLILTVLLSITSCTQLSSSNQSNGSNNASSNTGSSATCEHSWSSASCTTPKTCTKCSKTSGLALGHTTTTGICSRCGTNFSSWEKGEYVDEFNTPTGDKYIITDCVGTFSNSATSGSKLNASLQIDEKNIGIMLWEYGSHLVKGIYDYEKYNITILDDNGAKHYFTGTIYDGGTRVYFSSSDRSGVLNLLTQNNSLKIHLKTSKYTVSTYLFTVNCKEFSAIYASTFN